MTRYHPWRVLRAMKHVEVEWTDSLPADRLADTDGLANVRMAKHQLQVQSRVSITHEIIHMERGDTCGSSDAIEAAVRRETARRLIRLGDLVDAVLFHGEDCTGLADELWVDDETLLTRLQYLHPSERGYLLRRTSMKEHTA
jgi:hypothetical protein